eukprot:2756019-Pyramimonas_sp.AAC.1
MPGHICVDGSCATHAVKELSRAGREIVVVGDEGAEVCRITLEDLRRGIRPYAVAAMHAMPGSSMHSDCQNVVAQANEPIHALPVLPAGAFGVCAAHPSEAS